ncbi:RHS repeat-associated protein [Amycolatopsis bartoniae]|uniref:RHS repeat-associated core domain-containing protein n=1 Tax=Amycolatopsis bartoniae TaxID=941986 RepID=UPI00118F2C53|nr:RHS repeat-associated core domain-containing protein [Amycolatopsis bartoniae]MBB2939394.1 RHS repeat-associated protein [Amycolatopsis bartoniae]TVT06685.1 hypothetical protein FNH07_18920 [Amycolatopsis bartoniae]
MAKDKTTPVAPVVSHYQQPKPVPQWKAAPVTWPTGNADVSLSAAGHAAPAPAAAGAGAVRAGTLPVWLAPVVPKPGTAGPHAKTPTATPASAHVAAAPRDAATAAGVNGLILSVDRTDQAPDTGTVRLTLGYSQFADAFGGDWASRLHLVTLPACALTTPAVPACRTQTSLASTTDTHDGTVAADVALPGTSTAAFPKSASAANVLVAATSSPSGSGGNFTATSLKPSGSWQAGGSADAFTWSYPISVPDVPGGLKPQVALSYDSQVVDGLTSSTNNQASWLGDGWDYSPGYIERSYQTCHQNPTGSTQTWDNCWTANNVVTLSLAGKTTTLVKDDTTGRYHPQNDSNERVEYKTGGVNGSQGGEYFIVTASDGTQYYFGLNQLPGYVTGNAQTNSVWTEPVYSTSSSADEPAGCYNTSFAQSFCQLAYRWNLDYVVDPHSDVVSYFYNKENNFYAADLGTTATAASGYTRGGYLTSIQYGQQAGAVYTTSPAAKVVFNVTGRCNTTSGCAASSETTANSSSWPDVPFDLNCASGASCSAQSPSFWTENALGSIQTYALVGTTETLVDSWALTHSLPPVSDPNTKPALWLNTIRQTGQDTTGGGSTTPITLPPVSFSPVAENNRVNLSSGLPWITRNRIQTITTETGETITVDYTLAFGSTPACTPANVPAEPSANGMLCFPDYWTPAGATTPTLDWFNKYIVDSVTEHDPTGGSNDDIETRYTPAGVAAWHYNDSPLTPTTPVNQRTWDQWRGFSGMTVSTGTAPDPVTNTYYAYFRGMNGDTLPNNGTRSAAVQDVHGDPASVDSDQFTGMTYETVVYNGDSAVANIVSDMITSPWTSIATATHAMGSGLPALQAFLVGNTDKRVYTPLASGTTRETETDYTHDAYGRVTRTNDLGDVSIASQHLCSSTTYADNTTAWILNKPSEVLTVSIPCTTTPTYPQNAVSDKKTSYDSQAWNTPPTKGDATQTQDAISSTGTGSTAAWTYATTSATYDQYGRTLTSTNADNHKTATVYIPTTGAEPTGVNVTDPLGHTTKTTYDALRELPTRIVDPAQYVTTEQYDALGRLTAVYKPGNSATSGAPSLKYTYTVSDSAPSIVDTYTENDDVTYRVSETFYDALLRERETQTQTPDNERTITDTTYNTDGWKSASTDPYLDSNPVAPTYVQAQAGKVPSATAYSYDAAGRKTADIAYSNGNSTWQTTYTYGGNWTTTVPPAGGTATTTFTDARGNTTDLYQYHADVPTDPIHDPASDYSATQYSYTPANKQAAVTDPAGNTWSYGYDLPGNQTRAVDPDTGTTANTYDAAGLLKTTTDGRGKQVTIDYDNDGRKTDTYNSTGGAAKSSSTMIATWGYDSQAVGYPDTTTAFSGGDTYTQTVIGYTSFAEPIGVTTTLTGTDAALLPAGGVTTYYGYSFTGRLNGENDAAVGGLGQEATEVGSDEFGEPVSLSSTGDIASIYVSAVGYDHYGKPLQYTFPATAGNVWLTLKYDQQTQKLTEATATDSHQSTAVDDTTYSYSNGPVSPGAGLVTSVTDAQNGGATTDTQCFTYDYAQRLSQAWTGIDGCSATPTPGNSPSVGGPTPYWQSWTYDAAGDRLTQTDHDVTGTTSNDTTTTYNYPAAGSSTDQPHTLTSTTATGPQAGANIGSYTYDASGDTTSISGGATGNQTLTWTDQGKLATDATTNGMTSYVYDADGNPIVRRDPGQTTLFAGDEQIVLNTTTNVLTATRFYSIGGQIVAARSSLPNGNSGTPQYLIPDRQSTDLLAIDSDTYAVTRRQYLPFGQTRGATPTTWPAGNKGFVDGTPDTITNLENLGAREYDAVTGRFLSADPVFEAASPTQMGGYDYAANNPTTQSDPTGLEPLVNPDCPDVQCRNDYYGGSWSGNSGGAPQEPAADKPRQGSRPTTTGRAPQPDDDITTLNYNWQELMKELLSAAPTDSSLVCGNNDIPLKNGCTDGNLAAAAAGAVNGAIEAVGQQTTKASNALRAGSSDGARTMNALRNNPLLKNLGRLGRSGEVKWGGRFLLGVGAALSAWGDIDSALDDGESPGKAVAIGVGEAVLNTAVSYTSTLAGLSLGATIGTAIAPGVGTIIGAGVGALVGAAVGVGVNNVLNAGVSAVRRIFHW